MSRDDSVPPAAISDTETPRSGRPASVEVTVVPTAAGVRPKSVAVVDPDASSIENAPPPPVTSARVSRPSTNEAVTTSPCRAFK